MSNELLKLNAFLSWSIMISFGFLFALTGKPTYLLAVVFNAIVIFLFSNEGDKQKDP
ncbi:MULTISPECIES: hypothetical protein [Paenibacillus]|uniref:hypothetical protein n=1 Tax=Paenibacillus TaxID=44249 RepID=UPI0015BC557B|nr:hypothetical protein [Paenibacillus odorifer]